MATNNDWIATAHGNFSTAGNWSLGHAPTGDEVAMFSGNAFNCLVDQNVDCSGLVASGAYTGNITATGYAFWINGSFLDDGSTGTRNYGSGITIYNSTGTLHIGSTVGTGQGQSACVVTMNTSSSGSIDIDRIVAAKQLVLKENSIVYNIGSSALQIANYSSVIPLVFENNTTLTNHGTLTFRIETYTALMSFAGTYTYNGTGSNTIRPNGGLVTYFPAFTYTGTGAWDIQDQGVNYPSNINLSGNVVLGGNFISTSLSAHTGGNYMYFNTNNYNLTCTLFRYGNLSAGNPYQLLLGSSTINCTSIDGTTYNGSGGTTVNFGSATINCSGNFTIGSNHNLLPHTSTVNITNTSSISTNGKYLNNLNCSGAVANTITLSDLANLSGNFVASSGALTISSGIAFYGPTTTGNFTTGLGTVTTTNCALSFNASGQFLTDNKGVTIKSLTVGASGGLTYNGSALTVVTGANTLLTLGNNSIFTVNRQIRFLPTSSVSIFSFGTGYTWNGTGRIDIGLNGNQTSYLPSFNFVGTSQWSIFDWGAYTITLNISGNLNFGSAELIFANYFASNSTVNFNNFNITCGQFVPSFTGVFNWGSGIINCSKLSYTSSSPEPFNRVCTHNFQGVTINISGDATFCPLWTVNPGTSTVNITNTSTVTSNNKYFNNLNCSGAVTSVITLADSINLSGNFVASSGALTISSGLVFNGNNTSGIFNTGLGTVTTSGCSITSNASGVALNSNLTGGFAIKNLVLGTNATLTNNCFSFLSLTGVGPLLTFTNGGTYTNTSSLIFICNQTSNLFSITGSPIWNGTGAINVNIKTSSVTIGIPSLTYTGSGGWLFRDGNGGSGYSGIIYDFLGDFNIGNNILDLNVARSNSSCTFNTNNYNITCGQFNIGCLASTNPTSVFNFGSSNIFCTSYGTSLYNTGSTTINFQNSNIYCSGNFTYGSNHTINASNGVVNINPTANASITSSGKAFATLNFSGSNPLATGFFVDTPIISGNLGVYNGSSVNSSGLNISITSGCYITTSGNFSASGIYTIGKDLTFGSGVTLNNSNMTLNLSGQAHTITTGGRNFPYTKISDNSTWIGSGTIARLSLYAPTISTTHTWQAGAPYRFTSYTANDWNGTDLNHQILFRSSAAGFQSTFYAPLNTITRFTDYKDINNLGVEIDASDGTSTDTGNNYGINFGAAVVHPRRPHDENDAFFFIATKTFKY